MLMVAPLMGRIALEWGALRDVFFSPKTHKLCIVSDGGTGAPKTLPRLMSEVARCSDYIESAGLTVVGSAEGNSDC